MDRFYFSSCISIGLQVHVWRRTSCRRSCNIRRKANALLRSFVSDEHFNAHSPSRRRQAKDAVKHSDIGKSAQFNLFVRFETRAGRRIGIVANTTKRHHTERIHACRLLGKSGQKTSERYRRRHYVSNCDVWFTESFGVVDKPNLTVSLFNVRMSGARLREEINAGITTPLDVAESEDPETKLRITQLHLDCSESQVRSMHEIQELQEVVNTLQVAQDFQDPGSMSYTHSGHVPREPSVFPSFSKDAPHALQSINPLPLWRGHQRSSFRHSRSTFAVADDPDITVWAKIRRAKKP